MWKAEGVLCFDSRMKIHLQDFETQLRDQIGYPSNFRPFVCDGSPMDCRVFIVGFNPATTLSTDFWQFWVPNQGFDKSQWFDSYREDRRTQPLKPGKKRRNEISNTRRVLEWVLDAAFPVRCLETNLYATPTAQAADLHSHQRYTAVFDFLVNAIKPRIIVTHGKAVEMHVRSFNRTVRIISVSHFSRGWSQENARKLGLRLKEELDHCTT